MSDHKHRLPKQWGNNALSGPGHAVSTKHDPVSGRANAVPADRSHDRSQCHQTQGELPIGAECDRPGL